MHKLRTYEVLPRSSDQIGNKKFHIFMALERAMTRREIYESNKIDLKYPRLGGNALFSTTGASEFKPSRLKWRGGVRTKPCQRYELRTSKMVPQF